MIDILIIKILKILNLIKSRKFSEFFLDALICHVRALKIRAMEMMFYF